MNNIQEVEAILSREIEVIVPPVPQPTDIHVTFEHPKHVHVHFKPPMEEWIFDDNKGCEVYICRNSSIKSECVNKKVSQYERNASFTGLEYN
ncbi:hypothetical protein ANCCAN_07411, partial [Ancylostoma caninum]